MLTNKRNLIKFPLKAYTYKKLVVWGIFCAYTQAVFRTRKENEKITFELFEVIP